MKHFMAAFLIALPLVAQSTGGRIQSFRLQNGLRVLLLENHQHPLIRIQLRALWGSLEINETPPGPGAKGLEMVGNPQSAKPKGQTPLEPLALGMLDLCSVGNRSRGAFSRAVEERGLRLRLSGETDGPVWNLSGGSPEAESAFALLADAVTRPIPQGGDLDALRLRLLHELHERGSQETARSNFLHLLERPDLALEPVTEKSLGQVYLEDLQRAIRATLRPGRAVLAISGDLNLSQARQLAQLNFGTWIEGNEKEATLVPKSSANALVRPPMNVASDHAETIIALPFHAPAEKQRPAQELLSQWLPRSLGPDRCLIHLGAGGWRSLVLTAEGSEESLREALLALKKSGLKAEDLVQGKALWIARRRAMALHPQEQLSFAAKATLLGPQPSEQEIQAVDLGTFNATMQSWLDLDSARVLVFSSNQPPLPKTN